MISVINKKQKNPNVVLIILISKKYKDIATIFDELLRKYWNERTYKTIYCTDEKIDFELNGEQIVFNEKTSLPSRIRNIVKEENADYAICLLGDAFIVDFIDNRQIDSLINRILIDRVDYCNLIVRKKDRKEYYHKISNNESYPFSFICYIASKNFIMNEYDNDVSDLDLENKFNCVENKKYKFVRMTRTIIPIGHGIIKGKWVRQVYKKTKKISINARNNSREVLGLKDSIRILLADYAIIHLGKNNINRIHQILRRCS